MKLVRGSHGVNPWKSIRDWEFFSRIYPFFSLPLGPNLLIKNKILDV